MLIWILLIIAAIGIGVWLFFILRAHNGYMKELSQERMAMFVKGELEIPDEEFCDGTLAYFPHHVDGPLSGVYVIRNPSRGLMLIKPSNDMLHDIVKELAGFRNRDLASDGNSGRLFIQLSFPVENENLSSLLTRIRAEKGITDETDYDKTNIHDAVALAPKRDRRRVNKTRANREPLYWERH